MSKINTMHNDEITAKVEADLSAGECGCGGACPACAAHQEWLQSLSDEERDEFAQIVANY